MAACLGFKAECGKGKSRKETGGQPVWTLGGLRSRHVTESHGRSLSEERINKGKKVGRRAGRQSQPSTSQLESTHRGVPGTLSRKAGGKDRVGLREKSWPKVAQL